MIDTNFSRKLDSTGRLIIPAKLRTLLRLEPGIEYTFFTHGYEGKTYLCIECPSPESEIEKAIKILEKNGLKVSQD